VGDAALTVRQLRGDLLQLSHRAERLLELSDSEIRLTAQDLRSASDAVAVAARHFNDPRAVLFGPGSATLGPGEDK